MRQQRKSLWKRLLVAVPLVRVRVLRLEGLVQVLLEEQVLEPLLLEQQWRHRNLRLLWRASSWHRASTSRWRFSKRHRKHCASCQLSERWPQLRGLRRPTPSPI